MLTHEAAIRLGAFITVFTAMALWEAATPRRPRSYSRFRRWPSNLAIVALHTALVRILLPATAVSLAVAGFRGPLGDIAGAHNIPLAELPAKLGALAGLKARRVVLVCRTDKRSAKAAELIRDAGFEQVAVLRGGIEGWSQRGHVVER